MTGTASTPRTQNGVPASRYRLVDADSHVNEPPDLWISRVPSRYRDRVPHMEHFEQGDAWVAEGGRDPINFGMNVAAAMERSKRSPWVRWEDVPPGGYVAAERLKELDVDMIDAAVFYPTPRLSHLVNEFPKDIYAPGRITQGHAQGDLRFLQAPLIMVQFLNSGVFTRVPELQVVLAEVDAGWVPYVKEQLDNRFRRRASGPDARKAALPSEVIDAHFSYTYITDHYAVHNRHAVGVHRMMWSSDFPHSGSDWPASWRSIDADFADIPAAERDLILSGNAMRLYRFDERSATVSQTAAQRVAASTPAGS